MLQGKYLLTSSIGRGGMGEVFAAKRLSDGAEVAIKVVSHRIVDDTLMARLEREATAARRIKSIYVPEVYDVDRTEDGELYLVMRRLHGDSLAARLRERRALHWPEVERLVDDVLSALTDAHIAGVVHRDLKPGNIFLEHVDATTLPGVRSEPLRGVGSQASLTPAHAWIPALEAPERAMILDFGVCKMDGSDGAKLTITGESVGTVSYMAPEQIRGASDVDGRADLYALAMVIFEVVSGRIAFDQAGQMAILAAKLEGRAKRLRDCAVVAVPAGLDALVAKALSRKPSDRYASAREMQQAWRALGPATESPRAVLGASVAPTYATQSALSAGTHTRVGGMFPRAGLLVASFCVVASAIAIALALHRPRPVAPSNADLEGALAPSTFGSTDSGAAQPLMADPSSQTAIELGDTPLSVFPDGGRPHGQRWHHPTPSKPTQTGGHFTTEPRY
jgi:serine/threonine-protein kinase